MELIAFTGTPGTGKSTLAEEFSRKHNYLYINLNKFAKEHNLFESYDEEKKCYEVDTSLLTKEFLGGIKDIDAKAIVVDSHLSHHLPNSEVSKIVVCACTDLLELKKRLVARNYSESKVRENLDAEIFKVCETEANDQGHELFVVDTAGKSVKECVEEIDSNLV